MVVELLLGPDGAWLLAVLPVLGAAIIVAANISNVLGTWRGQWGSSPVTWTIWAALGWVGLGAQVSMGAPLGAILLVPVAGLATAVAVGAVRNRRRALAVEELGWQRKVDWACGVGSVVALAALLASSGRDALLLTIVTDAVAAVPTLVLAWRAPAAQPVLAFAGGAASAACTLAAVPAWTFDEAGYALYLLALCSILTGVIVVRRAWLETSGQPASVRRLEPFEALARPGPPREEPPTGRIPDAAQVMGLFPPALRPLRFVPAEQVVALIGEAWQAGHAAGQADARREVTLRPGWVDFAALRAEATRRQNGQSVRWAGDHPTDAARRVAPRLPAADLPAPPTSGGPDRLGRRGPRPSGGVRAVRDGRVPGGAAAQPARDAADGR